MIKVTTKRRMFAFWAIFILAMGLGTPHSSNAEGISGPSIDAPAWWWYGCPGSPTPRLTIGGHARVTPGLPNALRTLPGFDYYGSRVFAYIPGGEVFTVLAGPGCVGGLNWWLVNYRGSIGWTAEGTRGTYWLEPYVLPTFACPGNLPPRLALNRQAQVTPGSPNTLRSQPNTNYGSFVTGYVPGGGVITVLSGPSCGNGYTWFYVDYYGEFGFTVENGGYGYFINPL